MGIFNALFECPSFLNFTRKFSNLPYVSRKLVLHIFTPFQPLTLKILLIDLNILNSLVKLAFANQVF